MHTLRRLLKRFPMRYFPYLLLFMLLAGAVSVCEVLLTQQSGAISDAAISFDLPAIAQCMAVMAVLTAIKLIAGMADEWARGRFSGRAAGKLREGFASHFATIPYKALSGRQSGDVLSLYSTDLPRAARMLGEEIPQLIGEGALVVVSAAFMIYLQPLYSLIFFALFPPLMWMQAYIAKPIQQVQQESSKRRGEYNSIVLDSLQNTSAIVAYSLEETMEGRYDDAYQKYFDAIMRYIKIFSRLILAGIFATYVPIVFIILASALSVAAGNMTVGSFVALTTIAGSANTFLSMFSQRINSLQTCGASARRVEDAMPDEPEALAGQIAPDVRADALALVDVTFAYAQGGEPALRGVSLSIEKGSSVALVGASGSGKSTVAKLMESLYEPDSGSVRVFGLDTARTPKEALRGLIACVPQESFLLAESIRANIACGLPQGDGRIENACRSAGIHDFILSLPEGYDTLLSEDGGNLSGGQRQRLCVARALYRDAPILILDEATSALDPSTERSVLEGLRGAAKDRTTIVVAHRLSAIADCDRIVMLEDGRVIEDGVFDDLMGRASAFRALYERQMREGEDS